MVDQEIRFYRDRWRAVEDIERQETQELSIKQRWGQLNALISIAMGLGLVSQEEDDQSEVIKRWARLKEIY